MKTIFWSAILTALLAVPVAKAEDPLFLVGGEVAEAAYYSYAGLLVPGPGRKDGRGFFQRYWLDGFGYEYLGAPGSVEARAWGAEASLGWGTSSESGWGSISVGVRYTDTSLTPDDPAATARGSQAGVKVQVDGEHDLSHDWRLGAIASYTSRQNGYWGRLRLMRKVGGGRSIGAEFVANGNDEAEATAAGLVFSVQPSGSRWSLGLKAGYRFQDGYDGAYGGLEFGRSF